MERVEAYITATAGGVSWDAEGMMLDFVTLAKASGQSYPDALGLLSQIWADCHVEVSIAKSAKH